MIVNNYYIFVALNRYMALTLVLLEQIMQSEVENIHARIDEHRTLIDKLFDRLDSIDRQLSLLWLAVEDLKVEVAAIRQDMVTKADLDTALANYPTKSDLNAALANYPTKRDLNDALANYPTKTDLNAALANYATKADLEAMFAKYFPAPGS